jgi:hypothetical protein
MATNNVHLVGNNLTQLRLFTRARTHTHTHTQNPRTNVKIIFFYTQSVITPDMFHSILIILRQLMYINKANIKHKWFIQYIERTQTWHPPDMNCKNLWKFNLHILWTSSALLQMNLIISTYILCTNFNIFNKLFVFLYTLYWHSVTSRRWSR